jgi:type I restriction enzyme S subunit
MDANISPIFSAQLGGQEQFRNLRRGATKAGLGLDDIRNIWIARPPLAEQQEIVREIERRLSAANRLESTLKQQHARALATRQSLLTEAFAGRLVPQDSNDEPASILIERIHADREADTKEPKGKRMSKPKPSKKDYTRRPLITVLNEQKYPMTTEQLFREAGFEPFQVDLFIVNWLRCETSCRNTSRKLLRQSYGLIA